MEKVAIFNTFLHLFLQKNIIDEYLNLLIYYKNEIRINIGM